MKKHIWLFAVILASATWVACDDDDDDNDMNLPTADKSFVEMAALSNMAEIELGQLAAARGTDSLVRAFGQHMVGEHTTAQSELEGIADDFDNIDWPDDLDEKHERIKDMLEDMNGYRFDSMYMASQVKDHMTADSLFTAGMNATQNARIKAYASKYHPHIEMHLEHADSIYNVIITNTPDNLD
jgi:putative membrane protein